MRDDRPVRISQSANSNIPIDTVPIVMDSSLLDSAQSLQCRGNEYNLEVYFFTIKTS
jgi:hypothetical protein